MERSIVIGDVHGCVDELDALIKKVNYRPDKDSLYFLGDIINRGPCSRKAFERVIDLGAISIIGNHELHLLRAVRNGSANKHLEKAKREFGELFDRYIEAIDSWPAYIEKDEFILVHGGIVPGQPLALTDPALITSIRTWDGLGQDLNNPKHPPWFELYDGDKLVVFGHWARLEGVTRQNVIGIDTGCVYGKKLTAVILPERKQVSVLSRKVYYSPTG